MPSPASYFVDHGAGKDSLVICDTWEMADALNRRRHDTLPTDGPTVRAAREKELRVGDLIVSRRNDATIAVRPGTGHTSAEGMDQVRNGNRWASSPSTRRRIGLPPNVSPTTSARPSSATT